MITAGRLIESTNKPRLIKSDRGWVCVGLTRKRWFEQQYNVARHGPTPASAYHAWLYESGRAS
jgi:hypothetical protein